MKFLCCTSVLALYFGLVEARSAAVLDLADAARRVVEGTNTLRRSEGRAALEPEAKLQAAARGFAEWMAKHDEYGHEADGKLPRDRARAQGYEDCMVSENIAYHMRIRGFTSAELGADLLEGWKNSPRHRENMLDAEATQTAVAIAHSGETDRYYGVQMFGRPRTLRIRFQVRNDSGDSLAYRVGEREFSLQGRSTRSHEVCLAERLTWRFRGRELDQRVRDGEVYTVR